MRRNVPPLLLISLLIATLVAVPAQAGGGGGGCSRGFDDGRGPTVLTEGVCFLPTVVRIEAGDTVEFKNPDSLPHMVGGIGGSFGDLYTRLDPGKSVSYRFSDDGVYPYACVLHPGMGGAVVVGDGSGKAAAGGVVEVVPPKAAAQPVADTSDAAPTRGRLIPFGIALGVALLGLAALPRRRRTGTPAL